MPTDEVTTHYVTAEPLVPETFERFGTIISTDTLEGRVATHIYGGAIEGFKGPEIEANEGPIQILLSRTRMREFRVDYFERHHALSQTYVPLNGHTFIWVLAPPDAREEDGIPAFDEIHAFILPGDAAVKMHIGTWHESPFALRPGGVFFVISDVDINQSVRRDYNENGEIDNLPVVERRNVTLRTGKELRIRVA
jgi:ureidoglycolate lyase